MRFTGKVAIITGAGQGMGCEAARMFVEEGAVAVMNDIDGDRVRKASAAISGPGQAIPMATDVTLVDQVQRMVDQVVADHGRIDILVNNVGGIPEIDGAIGMSLDEATVDYWRRVIDWNLTSQFICCKAIAPIMKQWHYGRIINISTDAALRGTLTDDVAYPAAKAGVIGLTKELARYLGPYGITVNVVVPGDTLTEESYRTIEAGLWPETLSELSARYAYAPAGRPAEPREIASCIVFLASDDASYVNGETMMVTGGFHLQNVPAGGKGVRKGSTRRSGN